MTGFELLSLGAFLIVPPALAIVLTRRPGISRIRFAALWTLVLAMLLGALAATFGGRATPHVLPVTALVFFANLIIGYPIAYFWYPAFIASVDRIRGRRRP